MKQWLEGRHRVKVTTFLPKNDILDKECPGGNMLTKLFVLVPKKNEIAVDQAQGENGNKGGKESPNTTHIELTEAEFLLPYPFVKNPTDEITRDHEEDVHPNKSTWE
jgi:hypothetical protein